MHLEERVVTNQFVYDSIQSIVELEELITFIVLVRKDIFLEIHLHKV